jgi:hypothetical protein
MADSLAVDIRERVAAFLAGELELHLFQEWLVANTWDVEERGDPTATDVTYEIKLALAEHSRGDISGNELRDRMSEAIKTAVPAAT